MLCRERRDESEALPPRTHSPCKSDPLSSFTLEFSGTSPLRAQHLTCAAGTWISHGRRFLRRFGSTSRKTGGVRASGRVRGKLPMWREDSATTSRYGAWPLDKVAPIMHKPLRKRSVYVLLCLGIIYLRLGWVCVCLTCGSRCSHAQKAELQMCCDMCCVFTGKHRVPSDLSPLKTRNTFFNSRCI